MYQLVTKSYVYKLVTKSITFILDERVSFEIKTTSKTAKFCQTDLCNNEKNLSDLEKMQEFVSSDIAVFAFVNLGTVSNRYEPAFWLSKRC